MYILTKNIVKLLQAIALSVVLMLVYIPQKSYAAPDKCDQAYLRNLGVINLSCVEDTTCGDSTVTSANLPGGDNPEKIWNFFIQKGLKPYQAAGFLGNIEAESRFNPRQIEIAFSSPPHESDNLPPPVNSKGQPGYGLIQWTSLGRRDRLKEKVLSDPQKRKASDITLQLELIWEELNGAYKKSTLIPLQNSKDVNEASTIITLNYEIPANKAARAIERAKRSASYLAKYGSLTPSATPAVPVSTTTVGTGTTGCTGVPGSGAASSPNAAGIVLKALEYSWPEKRGLTPKPEYAAAVQQYNKAAPYNGADCGAFVGIVMKASGADPNYPPVGTSVQMDYVRKNPDKYDVTDNFKVEDLLPGDILIVNKGSGAGANGHTYIFVGTQPNGKNKADASLRSRMPNLGSAEAVDSNGRGHYTRARLK